MRIFIRSLIVVCLVGLAGCLAIVADGLADDAGPADFAIVLVSGGTGAEGFSEAHVAMALEEAGLAWTWPLFPSRAAGAGLVLEIAVGSGKVIGIDVTLVVTSPVGRLAGLAGQEAPDFVVPQIGFNLLNDTGKNYGVQYDQVLSMVNRSWPRAMQTAS